MNNSPSNGRRKAPDGYRIATIGSDGIGPEVCDAAVVVIRAAVAAGLKTGAALTPDLGGTATTAEAADAVCRALADG